ncbi:hypothetical protein MVEN_01638800 [Mycena venus]|uniref:Uncharacterized protein n=1 Tax=Mycena venus TaxID=2733690 RepID=A0A8H6XN36_9AGAR|nr:hypothetical protein MVEN_01638800 [Mycena venus]
MPDAGNESQTFIANISGEAKEARVEAEAREEWVALGV